MTSARTWIFVANPTSLHLLEWACLIPFEASIGADYRGVHHHIFETRFLKKRPPVELEQIINKTASKKGLKSQDFLLPFLPSFKIS